MPHRARPWLLFLLVLATGLLSAASPEVPRHPLEIRARTEPEAVLAELDVMLAAPGSESSPERAAWFLARANACRVLAQWICQRDAGKAAAEAAEIAGQPILKVRGLIAEARGLIALRVYGVAEQQLGEAERLLQQHPHAALAADVDLAYSSISEALGNPARARDHARRGIARIGTDGDWAIHVRLLRNLARAHTQLGEHELAGAALAGALDLLPEGQDPKLRAELHLEMARSDRARGRHADALEQGRQVLALSGQLGNSQLRGLGHELVGLAQAGLGDAEAARASLAEAWRAYSALGLLQDEQRALELWLPMWPDQETDAAEFRRHALRLVALNQQLQAEQRAQALDDLESRLTYARQEYDLALMRQQNAEETRRNQLLAERERLLQRLAIAGVGGAAILVGFLLHQRRISRRLANALADLGRSEARYRILADHARDLVVRMRADGERVYVSPSVRDMLGYTPEEVSQSRFDLVHPEDRATLETALQRLLAEGGSATVTYRVRHRDGDYRWLESLAQRVTGADGKPEIIYAARDVSRKIRAEQALQRSEARLRAVSDHLPALVAQIDLEERYRFANAQFGRTFGIDPTHLLGRSMAEVHDPALYQQLKPHIDAALSGRHVVFEGSTTIGGRRYHFQCRYVPDLDEQRRVQGFFSMTFDITELKQAQAELDRLARIDSLTGLANRRAFEDGLAAAVAHAKRHHGALALLVMDIDHFKQINDQYGHPAGDAVLVAFASRLRMVVRLEDLVARLGGDEFVILVRDAEPESGDVIAGKIVAAMAEMPISLQGSCLRVSCSVGVGWMPEPQSPADLVALADAALYDAKAAGRATWRARRESTGGSVQSSG